MPADTHTWDVDELLAVLTICDFLWRMTLPREFSRMIVECREYIDYRMTRRLLYGDEK